MTAPKAKPQPSRCTCGALRIEHPGGGPSTKPGTRCRRYTPPGPSSVPHATRTMLDIYNGPDFSGTLDTIRKAARTNVILRLHAHGYADRAIADFLHIALPIVRNILADTERQQQMEGAA